MPTLYYMDTWNNCTGIFIFWIRMSRMDADHRMNNIERVKSGTQRISVVQKSKLYYETTEGTNFVVSATAIVAVLHTSDCEIVVRTT